MKSILKGLAILTLGINLWIIGTFRLAATSYAFVAEEGICGAAARGDLLAVKNLLDDDPKLITDRDNDEAPIHWATEFGRSEIVKLLLDRGAAVNMTTTNGTTPLHIVSASQQFSLTKLLLERGADANALTVEQISPLYVASGNDTNGNTTALLVLNGAKPNVRSKAGVTPLQNAAFRGYIRVVLVLLSAGSDVNANGFDGATALHWAIDGQREETIELLLDFGADVNQKDDKGRDAFAWLEKERDESGRSKRRRLNRIEKLLESAKAVGGKEN